MNTTIKQSSKVKPVLVNLDTHQKLKDYCEVRGLKLNKFVDRLLTQWASENIEPK